MGVGCLQGQQAWSEDVSAYQDAQEDQSAQRYEIRSKAATERSPVGYNWNGRDRSPETSLALEAFEGAAGQ